MAEKDEGLFSEMGLSLGNRQQAIRQAMANNGQLPRGALIGNAIAGLMQSYDKEAENKFSFRRGMESVYDNLAAQGMGISVEEMNNIEDYRALVARKSAELGDTSTIANRIKVAEAVRDEAAKRGDGTKVAQLNNQIQQLKKEELEFKRLEVQNARNEAALAEERTGDAFTAEGDPVTGVEGNEEGMHSEVGGNITGLWITDENGELVFKRYGLGPNNISREDPLRHIRATSGSAPEAFHEALRRSLPKAAHNALNNAIVNGAGAVRQYGRIMGTIDDLFEAGINEGVFGSAGRAVTWMDQTVRGIRGVVGAAFDRKTLPDGRFKVTGSDAAGYQQRDAAGELTGERFSGMDNLMNRAANGDLADLIALPEGMELRSAEAQLYRANIMELAYMVAKMAEPSNRGLSDNDILRALDRLGGESANPDVIVRRFAELMSDQAYEIENQMDAWMSGFIGAQFSDIDGPLTEEIWDEKVGGKALQTYRDARTEVFEEFGITVDSRGNVTLDRPKDAGLHNTNRVSDQRNQEESREDRIQRLREQAQGNQ